MKWTRITIDHDFYRIPIFLRFPLWVNAIHFSRHHIAVPMHQIRDTRTRMMEMIMIQWQVSILINFVLLKKMIPILILICFLAFSRPPDLTLRKAWKCRLSVKAVESFSRRIYFLRFAEYLDSRNVWQQQYSSILLAGVPWKWNYKTNEYIMVDGIYSFPLWGEMWHESVRTGKQSDLIAVVVSQFATTKTMMQTCRGISTA